MVVVDVEALTACSRSVMKESTWLLWWWLLEGIVRGSVLDEVPLYVVGGLTHDEDMLLLLFAFAAVCVLFVVISGPMSCGKSNSSSHG